MLVALTPRPAFRFRYSRRQATAQTPDPDLRNTAWWTIASLAEQMLPPAARKLRAQASELDKLARARAKLIGDRAPDVIRLRCETEILRQQVAAWLAQNVDRVVASPQGRWLYADYLAQRHAWLVAHGRGHKVRLAGFASHREIVDEACTLLLHGMNLLADSKHPGLCRLFDELHTLWRNRRYQPNDDELEQDELGKVDYDALYKWAQRWHLLAPDGHVPDWILAQIGATFHSWQVMAQRGMRVLHCWPVIVSDFYGWPALDPGRQQRAEEFVRQQPDFCILTTRNRAEWHLHRQFARVAGMRVAPWVPLAHFVWTCRYQFGLERACDIAESPGYGLFGECMHKRYTRQSVYHAIRRTLALVGLRPRRDKRGPRP